MSGCYLLTLLQLPCCTAQTPAVLLQHPEKSQLRCVITCTRVCSEERHLWTWLRYSDTLPPRALLCHSAIPPCLLTICDFVFPSLRSRFAFLPLTLIWLFRSVFETLPLPAPKVPSFIFLQSSVFRGVQASNSVTILCRLFVRLCWSVSLYVGFCKTAREADYTIAV